MNGSRTGEVKDKMVDFTPMTEEEANAELPQAPDLSSMSDEDLNKALDGYEDADNPIEVEHTVLGETEPEPDPAPVEEPEQGDPQAADEAAPAEESAEEKKADEVEDDPNAEFKSMLELSELRAQKADAEMERWRHLADKNAGRLAHLEQQIKARELPRRESGYDDLSDREPGVSEFPGADARAGVVPPELQKELDSIRAERVMRALQKEGQDFESRHREFLTKLGEQDDEVRASFNADFEAELRQRAEEFHDALTGSDAKLAGVSARAAYDSALIEARIKLTERSIAASRERRAAQREKLIEQKRGSAPTTGTSAAPPPEASDTKPLHRMTDAELNDILRRSRF